MKPRDIVVIAGSAGSMQELCNLVSRLPRDFSPAVFVVVHTSPDGPGLLAEILARYSDLPAASARNNQPIEHGHIYVAPPDHHMLLADGHIQLGRGPKENGFRPAADPLFRTAARVFGSRVAGIILSGGLDDGTLGMRTIK